MFNLSTTRMLMYKEVMSDRTIILPSSMGTNISDIYKKCDRILAEVIFIFNISFQNVNMYLFTLYNKEPLYEAVGLCIFWFTWSLGTGESVGSR